MVCLNSGRQRLLMSIDWLAWSGYLVTEGLNTLPEVYCPDTYRLEILEGNNTFRWRAVLYDVYGRKVLTAMWCPKSKLVRYNLVSFQVANYWFYSDDDLNDIIRLSAEIFDYQFATFTRLDICVDFELNRQQKSIIKGLYHKKIYCSNKQNQSEFDSRQDNGDMFAHDFNFGSFKSAIKWKLYNKSKELNVDTDHQDKEYIINAWKLNGMAYYKIWRLEVSIKDFNKLTLDDFPIGRNKKGIQYTQRSLDFQDLTNEQIYNIYTSLYNKRCVFRKRKHTRNCNDEQVYLFRLDNVNFLHTKISPKKENRFDNSVMYKLIDVIESGHCKRNEILLKSSCDALFAYVKYNNLDGLFSKLKGMDVEKWCQSKEEEFGGGIISYV